MIEFLEIILIAFAMSIDAFSVALAIGCGECNKGVILRTALSFGIFQFIMPLAGWFLGHMLSNHFSKTNYIAAIILVILAVKMMVDTYKSGDECKVPGTAKGTNLLVLSLLTSMDAFGVGIPLSLMKTNILISSGIIGVVCFITSAMGVYFGRLCRKFINNKAGYAGAVVLFIIGIKMVIA